MRIYYDESGRITFTISGDLNSAPSGDYIEVEDQSVAPSDWRVENGALVRPDGWAETDLHAKRAAAIAQINAAAGEVRRLYITDIPGQPTIYQMKESEARAWLADPSPDPANYPFIAAEIAWTAPTGDQVAQVYLNLAAIYTHAAAQLEHARISHITMAENAATPEAAIAVAEAFVAMMQDQTGDLP